MFRFIVVGLPGLALAGCVAGSPSGLPDVSPYPSPSDPSGVGTVQYYGIVGGYSPRMPVSPTGWRGTAVEVAPLPPTAPGGSQ